MLVSLKKGFFDAVCVQSVDQTADLYIDRNSTHRIWSWRGENMPALLYIIAHRHEWLQHTKNMYYDDLYEVMVEI